MLELSSPVLPAPLLYLIREAYYCHKFYSFVTFICFIVETWSSSMLIALTKSTGFVQWSVLHIFSICINVPQWCDV